MIIKITGNNYFQHLELRPVFSNLVRFSQHVGSIGSLRRCHDSKTCQFYYTDYL